MIRTFKVTAEVDMDASKHDTVFIRTNMLKKVYPLAEKAFKEKGHFYVGHMNVTEIQSEKGKHDA